MLFNQIVRSGFVLGTATFVLLAAPARAASEDDRVLQKIAALEARIAALETENRAYKREAQATRVQAKPAADTPFRTAHAAMPVKAVVAAAPPMANWTGVYWGGSAGGAVTRSSVVSSERITNSFQALPLPPVVTGQDIFAVAGPSRGAGGLLDLYAGWNSRISNIVVGAQLEATAADLIFSSTGRKAYANFDNNGPNGQTAVGDFRPQVAARWIASVLLRAGLLVDEKTLVYGIGGWSIAQFEARNVTDNPFYQPIETFLANGWTAGAGIERKLDSNWSVRAEYRYTGFGTARTSDNFNFQFAAPPFLSQAHQRQTAYDQSMQAGRIGFAYTFNPLN